MEQQQKEKRICIICEKEKQEGYIDPSFLHLYGMRTTVNSNGTC